jgi:hypothetical protein
LAELPPPAWTAPVEPFAVLSPPPPTLAGADADVSPAVTVGETVVDAT